MSSSNLEDFLSDLKDLSNKHRLTIHGCGCCDSPWLKILIEGKEVQEYRVYTDPYSSLGGLTPEIRNVDR